MIKDLLKENNPEIEKSLNENFESHMKNVKNELHNQVKSDAVSHLNSMHLNKVTNKMNEFYFIYSIRPSIIYMIFASTNSLTIYQILMEG